MKKVLALALSTLPAFLLVSVAHAQDGPDFEGANDLISNLQGLLGNLIPLIIGIALIAVLWGLAKYAFAAGDPEKQQEGRRIIVVGIVILFVMVSIWGLVALLGNILGFDGTVEPPEPPEIPGADNDFRS